jgi:hypothetical protein
MNKNSCGSIGVVFDVPIKKNDGGENTKKIISSYTSDFSNRRVQFNLMQ